MGKLNEIQKQTTQSYGDNSFTTTIKENTVEFDSAKDSFTFNDPVEVPELRINGTEIVTFDAEDRAKLDSLTTTMQVKGRVDDISDLPDDASVGDVYLVGLSGDGNFEEYVCVKVSGSPATPVWENLGHVKTQSDWNQSNISADNYIKNKPAIKAGQGENSIVEGYIDNNVAGGVYAHAEGNNSAAIGLVSHAEGGGTTASGDCSHAEGRETTASGYGSHAEGRETTASGYSSHAEGDQTTATGKYSHVEGAGTIANHKSQHVFGECNIADPSLISASTRGTYIEIVGKGADENTRSNARTLDWSGNETLAGNLAVGGTITANGQEITPAEPQVQADWNQNDSESVDYIKNKPTIPSTQTQVDWNQTTSTESDYILNKPTKLSDFINDGEGDSPTNPFTTTEDVTNRISAHNSDITTHEDIRLSVASQGGRISAVEELIPAQATSSNNLADKEFINSSISTNTANFKGTYNTLAELEATTADNNDYGFIITTDASGNTVYNRYKYDGTSWSYEYSLNNSAFTAAQWDAINSNATASIISDLLSHASNISNPHAVTKSQVGLGDVDNTSDLNKPLSTAAVAEFATKQDALGFTPENVTNKKTSLVDNSDTYYPTQKAVKTAVDSKVTGAASSVANEVPVYDGTTGKVLKSGSGVSAVGGNLTIGGTITANGKQILSQKQSDWNQTTSTGSDYIKNKPVIKTGQGENSIVEGNLDLNSSTGKYSHAEGYHTTASADYSHAEGYVTTASGMMSHSECDGTTASGYGSHAEGYHTTTSGDFSHAEGVNTTASGHSSHVDGWGTTAKHRCQHVFGEFNTADPSTVSSLSRGTYVEIVGNGVEDTRSNARTLDWQGNEVLAGNLTIGGTITANGQEITPAEPQVQADWNQNDSEAVDYIKNKPTITSTQTQADWNQSTSTESDYILNKPTIKAGQGEGSIIEGNLTLNSSTGRYSHAEGNSSTASGDFSHAEGSTTQATGKYSHAEGKESTASGGYSHAEGAITTASGNGSHAEGEQAQATGSCSHAEGFITTASGSRAHAEGYRTTASHRSQHVFGEFNTPDPSTNLATTRGNYVEIVGNGADDTNTSNARTLDWQGNENIAGMLRIGSSTSTGGCLLMLSGSVLKISFNNGGTWKTVSAS